MSSGQFRFFAMPDEVLAVIANMHRTHSFSGIVPLENPSERAAWRCVSLDLNLINEQRAAYEISSITIREAPLEPELDLKAAYLSYPRYGFLAIDVPRVRGSVAVTSYAVYKDDEQLPTLVSPKKLFEAFRRELKRAFPHHVVDPENEKMGPKVWCSDGAVEFYRSGGILGWSINQTVSLIPVLRSSGDG